MTGDVGFFQELIDFYKLHKRKIKRALCIRDDDELVDFCTDFRPRWKLPVEVDSRIIKHEHVCKLAVIFSNVLGEKLPDHLHARMIFEISSEACKEYAEHVGRLRPKTFFGFFNPNPNKYRRHALSVNGMLSKLVSK